MFHQIDDRLTDFAANIWRSVESDLTVARNSISESGKLIVLSEPIDGPENNSERFFTMIWNSAKPFRWKVETDKTSQVVITIEGKLAGPVGFSFRFVRDPKEADGKNTFVIPWEML